MVECNFKEEVFEGENYDPSKWYRCVNKNRKNISGLAKGGPHCDEENCLFQQILKYSKYSRKTYVAIMEHWYGDLGYVDKGD